MERKEITTTAPMSRSFMLRAKPFNEDGTIEFSFSSETPVERGYYEPWLEVLSHAPGACDLTRFNQKAPFLFNHDQSDLIGVILSAEIKDGKGRCVVKLSDSERGKYIRKEIEDGILNHISVGYTIEELKLTVENKNGPDTFTALRWIPFEASLVPIPADISVGIGRSKQTTKPIIQTNTMLDKIISQLKARGVSYSEGASDADLLDLLNKSHAAEAEKLVRTKAEAALKRADAIRALGRTYGASEDAERAITEGVDEPEFARRLLEKLGRNHKPISPDGQAMEREARAAVGAIGQNDRERYSISRALERPSDGLEREVADEMARNGRNTSQRGGVIIPAFAFGNHIRTASLINTGAGFTQNAGMVPIEQRWDLFIDILRASSGIVSLMGRSLSGLKGNVSLPRQTAKITGAMRTEGESVVATDFDTDFVTVTQKQIQASTSISRELKQQGGLPVDSMISEGLRLAIVETLESAIFYGDGVGNNILGFAARAVADTQQANYAAAGAPTSDEIDFHPVIMAENNLVGDVTCFFGPRLANKLKRTRFVSTSTDSEFILDRAMTSLNGYKPVQTNVANGAGFHLFQAMMRHVWFLEWGAGVELVEDDKTDSKKGVTNFHSFYDCNIFQERAKAIAYLKNA